MSSSVRGDVRTVYLSLLGEPVRWKVWPNFEKGEVGICVVGRQNQFVSPVEARFRAREYQEEFGQSEGVDEFANALIEASFEADIGMLSRKKRWKE